MQIGMTLFGRRLEFKAAPVPIAPGSRTWWPIVREPYTGGWQHNEEIRLDTAVANPAVWTCVTKIAADMAKTPLNLVRDEGNGIWTVTTSPAFSPLLRRPNRYQNWYQFQERWMLSVLLYGNAYALKERDDRGVVSALYLLDATATVPLITPDSSVYYQLPPDMLAGLPEGITAAPSREIIHDRWNCWAHPLVGVPPLYACGAAAQQANAIQATSTAFFAKGGRPSGILLLPTEVDQATGDRIGEKWRGVGPGQILIMGRPTGQPEIKYQDIGASASASQTAEQYAATIATIAGCYGFPVSFIDGTKQPPYANAEATYLQYGWTLDQHMTRLEWVLDAGLELPSYLDVRFDRDDLVLMDTATKIKSAHDAIAAGLMTHNEARQWSFGLPPLPGGDTLYMQQQYWPIADLGGRPAPAPVAAPAPPPTVEAAA